jgi:hypothetical protein
VELAEAGLLGTASARALRRALISLLDARGDKEEKV